MALAHSAKTVEEHPQLSSLMASFKVRCSGVGGAILRERTPDCPHFLCTFADSFGKRSDH